MNKRILVLWAIMIAGISIQATAQTEGNIRGVKGIASCLIPALDAYDNAK
jgi:hypothetical protein